MKKLGIEKITFGIMITSLLLIIVLSSGVIAVGFSPSSLIYNLKVGEESCQRITITSDSETISVSDKWAENSEVEWKTSLFDTSAGEHGININYDNELSSDEREVEVCLSGSRVGEYHGVMLLREEQQGNSIVQMGVWLKVIISEKENIKTQSPQTSGSSGGDSGTGGSGSGGSTPLQTTSQNQDNQVNGIENSDAEAGITGNVASDFEESASSPAEKIIGAVLVLAGVVGLFLHHRYKRIRNEDKFR